MPVKHSVCVAADTVCCNTGFVAQLDESGVLDLTR